MGGKSSDYGQVADIQGDANRQVVRDQLVANRPDQYSPWGYTSWDQTPYTDPTTGEESTRWTQTTGLSPELQDIFNKQMAIQGGRTDIAGMLTGRMGGEFGTPMDWRGLSPVGSVPTAQYTLPEEVNRNLSYEGIAGVDDPYQTRQRAEDSVYNQAMSRLQPSQESEKANMEMKLRNQGLRPGDAQWQAQIGGLDRKHSDQQNQALWSANQAGRDESSQMFGQQMGRRQQYGGERETQAGYYNQAAQQAYQQALGANQQNFGQSMAGSQYANQIRQQQIAEMMQQRGSSLNEINALLSGQQVALPSMPGFSQASAAQPAPIYQSYADQQSTNAASSPWNALLGAAGTAGGAYLGTL